MEIRRDLSRLQSAVAVDRSRSPQAAGEVVARAEVCHSAGDLGHCVPVARVDKCLRTGRCLVYRGDVEYEAWVVHRADSRAVLTNAADPGLLAEIVADWLTASVLPASVGRLWERACNQFRSGPIAYENFTEAVRTGFEAVDAALRHHIADLLNDGKRLTLGPLIDRAYLSGRLSTRQYDWLSVYALRFRNRLTHSDGADPLVLSPPLAAEMMEGISRFLAELVGVSTA